MPSPFKGKKSKPARTKGTALDAAQRELNERQNKVQAEIDALQRRLAEEQAARPAAGPRRGGSGAVPPGQYVHGVAMSELRRPASMGGTGTEWPRRRGPRRPTMLREERKAARRQTMALIMVVVVAAIYAVYHLVPAMYALRHLMP